MRPQSSDPVSVPSSTGESDAGEELLTPLRLLLLVLASIAVAEFSVMLVLFWPPSGSRLIESVLDATSLIAIIFPLLYLLMFVPMSSHIEERVQAEEELRRANLALESLVEERTADLVESNQRVKGEMQRRLSAEGEAGKSHDLLLRVVESSPCMVIIYDASTERCLFVNGRIVDMLGYTPEEAIVGGEGFFRNLLDCDDYRSFSSSTQGSFAVGQEGTFRGVFRLRQADGEWRRFRVATAALRTYADGRPREMLFSALEAFAEKA